MLSFIGLGLYGYDITLEALQEAKRCDKLYAEFYTSRIGVKIKEIEKLIGKKIEVLDRKEVEEGNRIIKEAKEMHVGFLVAGEPMTATTHVELRMRAMEEGIETRIFHGVSIVVAAASLLGLQIYKFGRIVSIPRPYENYFPLSPYDSIKDNLSLGLHTLILLDIGDNPMTANEAIKLLLEMERRKKEGIIKKDRLLAVISISKDVRVVKAGYAGDMMDEDFGRHIHSIIIPGKLHIMEAKALVKIGGAPEEILKKI